MVATGFDPNTIVDKVSIPKFVKIEELDYRQGQTLRAKPVDRIVPIAALACAVDFNWDWIDNWNCVEKWIGFASVLLIPPHSKTSKEELIKERFVN